jgi:hypothetical protein
MPMTAGIDPAVAAFWTGVIESVGALLVVAGTGKAYLTLLGVRQESAIRQAFRISPHRWRIVQLSAGLAECATGLLVCSRILPAAGGAAMAGLGLVFVGSLIHARQAGASGGCGCIGWKRRATSETIRLREIARAVWIVIAGVLCAVVQAPASPPFGQPLLYAGFAAGCLILVLLSVSVDAAPSRLRCGWRRRRNARSTLATLAGHPVYEAMAESVGPFASEFGYRGAGCTEEYWFAGSRGPTSARQVTAFRVTHLPGRELAVQASLEDRMPENLQIDRWLGELAAST